MAAGVSGLNLFDFQCGMLVTLFEAKALIDICQ